MKVKAQLSYTVECVIEGSDEDSIMNWLCTHTPSEVQEVARKHKRQIDETYGEGIIEKVSDNTPIDINISWEE